MAGIGTATKSSAAGGTTAVNLTQVAGSTISLGQALAAASLPVVLTAAQITTLTPLATVAVTQSTSPWVVSLTSTTVTGSVAVTNAGLTELAAAINASSQMDVNIAASGATVPVSGTFWQATQPISGTITANAGTNLNTSALLTATNFSDAFGTAGSADTQVMSVQGIASMTPVQVSQATASNLNATVSIAAAQTLSTVTTVTTLTGGGIAHDSADSGNPHKVGFKAFSPDGTTPGTAVAENDRTDAKADLDGRLYVNTVSPVLWSYHENSSNALTDTEVKATPGAGFSIFVTDIVFSTGSATACNIFLEEGATTVLGPYYLEAVAGRGLALHFTTPKKITASTALTVTTSAAIAHSLDVMGYVSAV